MHLLRRVSTALALLLISSTASAKAATVHPEAGAGCGIPMTVDTWRPAQGAPARWAADRLRDAGCDALLVMGASDAGVWTVEATTQDASGFCLVDLVLTKKSGYRVAHPVLTHDDQMDEVSRDHAKILARLWRLAKKGTWPVATLRRPTKVTPSSYDPNDLASQYPGFLVRVEDRRAHRIYDFLTVGETEMCWCFHHWQARVMKDR
ncbi:MAG: hypothetical protein R3B72_33240 [Polyangiaceae bacterium]